MRPLAPRERKLVAIGLLVLVIALVWLAAIAPLLDGFSARAEQRALLQATYARNSRLIAAIPQLRRRIERQGAVAQRFALRSPNVNIARATLRDRMRAEAVAVGAEITALQDVPSSPDMVRAWMQGRMTLAQLQQLLVRLSNGQPYLVIESLRISASRALETGRLDQLDVRIETSIPFIPAAA